MCPWQSVLDEVTRWAERKQTCRRKAVGCVAVSFEGKSLIKGMWAHNGPTHPQNPCSGEKGNCGCFHAEQSLVLKLTRHSFSVPSSTQGKYILVCNYSPCTTCANAIIASGLFAGVVYKILTEHDTRGVEFLKRAMPVVDISSKDRLDALTRQWIVSCRVRR